MKEYIKERGRGMVDYFELKTDSQLGRSGTDTQGAWPDPVGRDRAIYTRVTIIIADWIGIPVVALRVI
jgi:hypothetical protein